MTTEVTFPIGAPVAPRSIERPCRLVRFTFQPALAGTLKVKTFYAPSTVVVVVLLVVLAELDEVDVELVEDLLVDVVVVMVLTMFPS